MCNTSSVLAAREPHRRLQRLRRDTASTRLLASSLLVAAVTVGLLLLLVVATPALGQQATHASAHVLDRIVAEPSSWRKG
ncbi:MAG: hypothetical protein ABSG43_01885 [Solirubrobacteraceae bacterium]